MSPIHMEPTRGFHLRGKVDFQDPETSASMLAHRRVLAGCIYGVYSLRLAMSGDLNLSLGHLRAIFYVSLLQGDVGRHPLICSEVSLVLPGLTD